jgi:hypothetical protein
VTIGGGCPSPTARDIEGVEFAAGRRSTFVVTRVVLDRGVREDDWIMVVYGYRKENPNEARVSKEGRRIHFTGDRGLPEELHGLFEKIRYFYPGMPLE